MRILDLHIDGFGKLEGRDFALSEGVNILFGHNEAGKSTLHSFIEAMLTGPDRKPRNFSHSVHEAMQPWGDAPYKGSMRILTGGKTYRIDRDFSMNHESLRIYDEQEQIYLSEPQEFLSGALYGLSADALKNTIAIGQLSTKTGAPLAKEVLRYVENMGSTGNPGLSAGAALSYLKEQKETLSAQISDGAARDYAASLSRIKNIETEINVPENRNRILEVEKEKDRITEELSELDQKLCEKEEEIAGDSRFLLDHHISGKSDVEERDAKADTLYAQWMELKKDERRPFRIALIVFPAVLFVLSLCGLWMFRYTRIWMQYAVTAGVSLILTVITSVMFSKAVKRFRKKDREFLSFMNEWTEETEVTGESVGRLKECFHAHDDILSKRDSEVNEKEELSRRKMTLSGACSRVTEEARDQQMKRFMVEGKLSEENTLRNRAAELRDVISKNNRLKEQIDAIDIAIDTISDLEASIRGRMGTWLNNEASKALSQLTGGAYHGMDIGNGSSITVNSKEGMISIADLSAGTVDQVYLAVRLAAARFMMNGEDGLPLIFDDSFALYDNDRLESAMKYIAESYQGQILIFTCHKREMEALPEESFRLIEL